MARYYIYECKVFELDTEKSSHTDIFYVHSADHKLHETKEQAFRELRDILHTRCNDNATSFSS